MKVGFQWRVCGGSRWKKAYGEEGGDDIDYDRRQLSSDESLSLGVRIYLFVVVDYLISFIYMFMAQEKIYKRGRLVY